MFKEKEQGRSWKKKSDSIATIGIILAIGAAALIAFALALTFGSG